MNVIQTPQTLYHGTTLRHLHAFRTKLLDYRYWRPGTDFGEGLYTATSLQQARKWAQYAAKKESKQSIPCVLELELIGTPKSFKPQLFLGLSLSWSHYIWAHRLINKKGTDPCKQHADLIIGPTADNDIEQIMQQAIQFNKDHYWFYDKITRTPDGRKIDVARIGHQVVFATEQWEPYLRIKGYYLYHDGRWSYHRPTGEIRSL